MRDYINMIEILPSSEDYQHIRDKIIDYLARQGFSERKLLQKVTNLKKNYPRTKRYVNYTTNNVQKVINELKNLGIVDDRKYANDVLRQLRDRKDGILRIRQKMYRRLISAEIINEVLENWKELGVQQDYSMIIRDTQHKYERLCEKYTMKKDKYTIQTKLYAYLAQKGYFSDEVKYIINKINESSNTKTR